MPVIHELLSKIWHYVLEAGMIITTLFHRFPPHPPTVGGFPNTWLDEVCLGWWCQRGISQEARATLNYALPSRPLVALPWLRWPILALLWIRTGKGSSVGTPPQGVPGLAACLSGTLCKRERIKGPCEVSHFLQQSKPGWRPAACLHHV